MCAGGALSSAAPDSDRFTHRIYAFGRHQVKSLSPGHLSCVWDMLRLLAVAGHGALELTGKELSEMGQGGPAWCPLEGLKFPEL